MLRTATAQRAWLAAGHGTRINPDHEEPGDLIFWDYYLGPNHIGPVMIIWKPAKQTTIEARGTREGVGHFSYANGPRHDIFEIWRVRKSPTVLAVPAYVHTMPGSPGGKRTEAASTQSFGSSAAGTPGSIGRSHALFTRWLDMHLSSSSAAGVRFLTSVREGRGLNRSAREAGIGKETGYRWLREAYVAHRRGGKSIAEVEAVMGLASAKSIAWEAEVAAGPGRHHLRVAVDAEARFWASFDAGTGADAAACAAGDWVSVVRPAIL